MHRIVFSQFKHFCHCILHEWLAIPLTLFVSSVLFPFANCLMGQEWQWFIYYLPGCKFWYWFNFIKFIVSPFWSALPNLHILFFQSCLFLLLSRIFFYSPCVPPHAFFWCFLSRKIFTLCLLSFFRSFVIFHICIYYIKVKLSFSIYQSVSTYF